MNIPDFFNGPILVIFFFKAFACLFSFMYFVYSFVVYRQVKTMATTVQVKDSGIVKRENLIITITNLQILISILLLIFSILIVFS